MSYKLHIEPENTKATVRVIKSIPKYKCRLPNDPTPTLNITLLNSSNMNMCRLTIREIKCVIGDIIYILGVAKPTMLIYV